MSLSQLHVCDVCRREDITLLSLSYFKEKSSKLVLYRWRKDYEERAKHSTFWRTSNQTPNTKPSDNSKMTKKSLDTLHSSTQCTATTHNPTASTYPTKARTVIVEMPLPPTQKQSENTSFTYAPSMPRNTEMPSPWYQDSMKP